MVPRLCSLPRGRSSLLLGPRQTGKSTLVTGLLPQRAWTVDLLEHDTFLRYAKRPSRFGLEAEARVRSGVRTIFVDEVQKVPALLDEIHALIERTGARFLLTGSSARKLRRGSANLLAGRAIVRRLHPLTYRELGAMFDLERTLRFGALPPAATKPVGHASEFLETYARTYLHEEVQAEALVRNLGGFARFLDIAAAQCGDALNFSAVGRDAGLPTRTVQEYYQILEDTLLGFRLEAWRKSPRARMVTHPRFYLFDTGVTNALCRRLGAEPDSVLAGRLFEQFIVLECCRLIDYLRSEVSLYYWRTHVGAEVDLLFERHGRLLLAAEIKSTASVSGAHLSGLRSFGEAHPEVPRVVVSRAPEEYRLSDVTVLPWRAFLDGLERRLGVTRRLRM